MFCPECGIKNDEDAFFCESCGSRIITKDQNEIIKPAQVKKQEPPVIKVEKVIESPKREVIAERYVEPEKHIQTATKAKRRPMSRVRKVIIVEVILLLLVSFAFYKVGTEKTSPESAAIEFARNINERDWNPLYESLLLSRDKFISKEMFIKGISDGEPISARNYMISDVETSYDGNNMRVWVDFIVDSGDFRTIEVNLLKDEEKEFLIFDKWKVIPDFLVYDFEIQVPSGAKVSLGGIELDETYQSAQDEFDSWFNIPVLFSGEYDIKVSMEPMDEYIGYVHSQDGYFSLQNMNLSEETQKMLVNDAAAVLKETYTAAFEGKNFNEIKHLFTGEKTNTTPINTTLKEEYDGLIEGWSLKSGDVMKKLEVNYLDAEMEYFMRDGKANAVVYIDFEGEFEEGVNGNRYYATSYGESIYNYEYNNNEWNIITHNLDLNLY